ncbi:5'-nucleotidase C-terminal domain-containing protein [Clostridium sp. Cult2]|uniref:5'-nucleotidase C-terminal domain-containing protein n=1 Tax=Clostridium sp. Cult2 TaxID=2079003 RepID=UPI001F0300B4|nr:5'-nucleotidase C-terminal domain-containing protein [Clostridium sp. Cult2]MCF6466161.1 multifunctional 2',3'-cyclic-nucleotide 2'-phosphodiesterase/5'-nucleotidase/3'-nucleotidase [Clostridium sp. Cult2]
MNFRNKRLLSLFLSLALVLGMFLVPVKNVVFAEEGEVVKLTIVHTNDVHSRVKGDDDVIGYPRLATKVNELKAENPNVLVLDAGDTTHGLPIITVSRGEAMIRLMNEVGYDAMTPGNHDFNYGYERLVELNEMAEFPILAANVIKEDGTRDLDEYAIKEIDGLKIGIFGLATQESKYKSNPKNTEGVDIVDPVAKAKEMVEKLKEEEVNMIIALVHIGVDDESDPKSTDIAEKVEGIDLVIDGHSHTLFEEGKLIGDTLLVQTGNYLNNIGIVNVEFTDGEVTKKEATLFTREEAEDLEEEPNIKSIIEGLDEENKEVLSVVIGKTKVRLDGDREIVRTQESNFGNLMTDAMLSITGADVAITNGGGIRAPIEVGEITKGNVLEAFPFGNYGVLMEIKGVDILNALEHGVTEYPESAGKFPQVAGMTYKIDPTGEAGNRVKDLKIKGEPIDLNKVYKLATNDFMAVGGDGYVDLANGNIVAEFAAFDEMLAQYIEELGEVDISVEGRITEVEKAQEETYVVKSGDVLWRIAEKFNTTWEKLAEYNKLNNPHLIFPGQKILVPAK